MADLTTNTIKERTLQSAKEMEAEAFEKMEAKKAEYKAAMQQLSVFENKLYVAERDYLADKTNDKNKSIFTNIKSQKTDAEIDVSVLRSGLQNRISHYGKMANSASLTQAILG